MTTGSLAGCGGGGRWWVRDIAVRVGAKAAEARVAARVAVATAAATVAVAVAVAMEEAAREEAVRAAVTRVTAARAELPKVVKVRATT
jgi:hypothetical protein